MLYHITLMTLVDIADLSQVDSDRLETSFLRYLLQEPKILRCFNHGALQGGQRGCDTKNLDWWSPVQLAVRNLVKYTVRIYKLHVTYCSHLFFIYVLHILRGQILKQWILGILVAKRNRGNSVHRLVDEFRSCITELMPAPNNYIVAPLAFGCHSKL